MRQRNGISTSENALICIGIALPVWYVYARQSLDVIDSDLRFPDDPLVAIYFSMRACMVFLIQPIRRYCRPLMQSSARRTENTEFNLSV